jgi:hypothetical protein
LITLAVVQRAICQGTPLERGARRRVDAHGLDGLDRVAQTRPLFTD